MADGDGTSDPGVFDWIGNLFSGTPTAQPATPTNSVAAPTFTSSATGAGVPQMTTAAGVAPVQTSGQSGQYAAQLKKALGDLQTAAKAPDPGSPFPFGKPQGALAPTSRGSAPAQLADLVDQLRQRRAMLQTQYLQPGNFQPRAPGAGLLGS